MSHTVVECAGLSGAALATGKSFPLKPTQPQWSRFTVDDMKDPVELYKLLETIRADIASILSAQSAHPFKQSIIFRNLSVSASPLTPVTLRHNFNRRAFWSVVASSTQFSTLIYESAATDATITFTPYVTGVVSVLVF